MIIVEEHLGLARKIAVQFIEILKVNILMMKLNLLHF
jgi:hypothetical protein